MFFCQKYCGPYCIGRGMISSSNCNKAQPGTAHILPSCLYIFAGGKQSRLGLANSAFDPHQQKSWRTFPDKSKQGFFVGNCNCAEGRAELANSFSVLDIWSRVRSSSKKLCFLKSISPQLAKLLSKGRVRSKTQCLNLHLQEEF